MTASQGSDLTHVLAAAFFIVSLFSSTVPFTACVSAKDPQTKIALELDINNVLHEVTNVDKLRARLAQLTQTQFLKFGYAIRRLAGGLRSYQRRGGVADVYAL